MAIIEQAQSTLRIEIPQDQLAKMLCSRSLAAADIRCLDGDSKKLLWQLCLQAAIPTDAHCGDDK